MSEPIKTTHAGIEIEYDELENRWSFINKGRQRSAASLSEAKQAINKLPKVKKPFEEFDAYLREYSSIANVRVIAVAEPSRYRNRPSVWVRYEDGHRSKEQCQDIFVRNDFNTSIVKQIQAMRAEKEEIGNKIESLSEKLVPMKNPDEA